MRTWVMCAVLRDTVAVCRTTSAEQLTLTSPSMTRVRTFSIRSPIPLLRCDRSVEEEAVAEATEVEEEDIAAVVMETIRTKSIEATIAEIVVAVIDALRLKAETEASEAAGVVTTSAVAVLMMVNVAATVAEEVAAVEAVASATEDIVEVRASNCIQTACPTPMILTILRRALKMAKRRRTMKTMASSTTTNRRDLTEEVAAATGTSKVRDVAVEAMETGITMVATGATTEVAVAAEEVTVDAAAVVAASATVSSRQLSVTRRPSANSRPATSNLSIPRTATRRDRTTRSADRASPSRRAKKALQPQRDPLPKSRRTRLARRRLRPLALAPSPTELLDMLIQRRNY